MANSKLPKNFSKMSLNDQEDILVAKLYQINAIQAEITKALAKVRGGNKYTPKEIDRLDLLALKDEN